MAATGRIYAGPEVSLLKRLALRHSGSAATALAIGGVFLWVLAALTGKRLPAGLMPLLLTSLALLVVLSVWAMLERSRMVRETPLPQFLKRKLRETYPHLSAKDAELVERGLRQFFLACQRSRKKFVAMPSRVVDSMWHEFILHTAAYRDWCDVVLGRFIDHVPAEVLSKHASQAKTNDGLRRAWYWACREEAIQPRRPSRLPLLFALDAKLGIANGFVYVPDCRKLTGDGSTSGAYCGESFSDGSYSGESGSFGGSESSSSSGDDSDGGGDGGGGCGGGGD